MHRRSRAARRNRRQDERRPAGVHRRGDGEVRLLAKPTRPLIAPPSMAGPGTARSIGTRWRSTQDNQPSSGCRSSSEARHDTMEAWQPSRMGSASLRVTRSWSASSGWGQITPSSSAGAASPSWSTLPARCRPGGVRSDPSDADPPDRPAAGACRATGRRSGTTRSRGAS